MYGFPQRAAPMPQAQRHLGGQRIANQASREPSHLYTIQTLIISLGTDFNSNPRPGGTPAIPFAELWLLQHYSSEYTPRCDQRGLDHCSKLRIYDPSSRVGGEKERDHTSRVRFAIPESEPRLANITLSEIDFATLLNSIAVVRPHPIRTFKLHRPHCQWAPLQLSPAMPNQTIFTNIPHLPN